jgi:GNAT superfamily N-acetyltransferase
MSVDGAVSVRSFEDADERAVIDLLHAAFGRWPRGIEGVRAQEFFRWKHRGSPFGRSVLLVGEADGVPLGFLALMPWRLRFGEQIHLTMRGVDLAVDPAAQRRGISMKLIAAVRERYGAEVAMGWSNPNQRSRTRVLKSGRRRVDGLPRFVGLGAPAWGAVRRLALHGGVPLAPVEQGGEEAAVVLGDETLLAHALGRADNVAPRIETARSTEFLRWRYGPPNAYKALTAEGVGGRAGVAVFRTQRHGRLRVAHIYELLSEQKDRDLSRALVRDVRRVTQSDLVVCAFSSWRMAARCGLAPAPTAATVAVNPLLDGLEPDPTDPASWALSLGDLELI